MLWSMMNHRRNVQGEQLITLQMVYQIKTKNINVVPDKVDEDKVQSVTDTDNEFTDGQTPRRKLQSNWHFACQLTRIYGNLQSDISEPYKVQFDYLKDSQSDSYYKNDMKEKVNDLVRLHELMQQKLKTSSYSEQIQILTLVPGRRSPMYCSEYSNVFEYLVRTSH